MRHPFAGPHPMTFFTKLIFFLTVPLYLIDQATKFWTINRFEPPWVMANDQIVVIDNFFELVRVHNQGVAFGFGNGTAWAPVVFLFVPIIALTLIRIFWKKGVFKHVFSQIAVALLLCGILGNLTDRLIQGFLLDELSQESFWTRLSNGYVVDFLRFRVPFLKTSASEDVWWPVFNVADSCICIAAVLLFIGGIREEQLAKKQAAQPN